MFAALLNVDYNGRLKGKCTVRAAVDLVLSGYVEHETIVLTNRYWAPGLLPPMNASNTRALSLASYASLNLPI